MEIYSFWSLILNLIFTFKLSNVFGTEHRLKYTVYYFISNIYGGTCKHPNSLNIVSMYFIVWMLTMLWNTSINVIFHLYISLWISTNFVKCNFSCSIKFINNELSAVVIGPFRNVKSQIFFNGLYNVDPDNMFN